jgi:hypothetical protein
MAQPCGGDVHNSTLEQYAKVHMAELYFCRTAAMSSEHTTYTGTQPIAIAKEKYPDSLIPCSQEPLLQQHMPKQKLNIFLVGYTFFLLQ